MANFYRDIFINKGADFSQIIEISVPFDDYDFEGYIKSSYASQFGVPLTFSAVTNEPKKVRISLSADVTELLGRRRGVYDIFAIHKQTGEKSKEREGIAHYSQSASFAAPAPPPVGYQIRAEDIIDAGSAIYADVENFATATQGQLAETALQPEEFRHEYDSNLSINYLGRAPQGSLESDEEWIVTRITIASNGTAVSDASITLITWTDRANPLNYN